MFKLLHYGETNVGRERKNNEDAFRVASDAGVFLVCDGMGGHASGEIASQIAADAMIRFLVMDRYRPDFKWPAESLLQSSEEGRAVDAAVRFANREVLNQANTHPLHKGMGTTIVGVLASAQRLALVHVGDSRIYRYRQGELDQLTDDHSLLNHYIRTRPMSAQQIKQFAGKNVIVRAVGLRDMVEPDVQLVDFKHDDLYLLCSDGLTDMVEDEQITEILAAHTGNPSAAGAALVQAALEAGGKDNITVLLLHVLEMADEDKVTPFGRLTQSMLSEDTDVVRTPTELELAAVRKSLAALHHAAEEGDEGTPAAQPAKPPARGAFPSWMAAAAESLAGQEITERIPASAQFQVWQAKTGTAKESAASLWFHELETLPMPAAGPSREAFKQTAKATPGAKAQNISTVTPESAKAEVTDHAAEASGADSDHGDSELP